MHLKKAKTCDGCKALCPADHGHRHCELGFDNYGPLDPQFRLSTSVPQVPCYKPRTITELFESRDSARMLDRSQFKRQQHGNQ